MRKYLVAGAVLVVVAGVCIWNWRSWVAAYHEADARQKLAFESLVDRLPRGKAVPPKKWAGDRERWSEIDQYLAMGQANRTIYLKALHERTQRFFIDSPGAGSSRDIRPEGYLMIGERSFLPPPEQPGQAADFPLSPGETLTRLEPSDVLRTRHFDSLLRFLQGGYSFGYVKDRTQVSGFRPHQFSGLSWNQDEWKVEHILLVGILSYDEPVVYLSDRLPSMELARQGKTRPLDAFEAGALAELAEGQDLAIAKKDDVLRVLGALRATGACQQCHDAEIGDLLGAFSYTLRPAPPAPRDE